MNYVTKTIAATTLSLSAAASFASPSALVTHNLTDVESNAFIVGTIPSNHPTKAYADGKVSWAEVRLACFGRTINGLCWAMIKMNTNTSHPIELGILNMSIETGEITPSHLSAGGYTMTVNGPGETTLSKD